MLTSEEVQKNPPIGLLGRFLLRHLQDHEEKEVQSKTETTINDYSFWKIEAAKLLERNGRLHAENNRRNDKIRGLKEENARLTKLVHSRGKVVDEAIQARHELQEFRDKFKRLKADLLDGMSAEDLLEALGKKLCLPLESVITL